MSTENSKPEWFQMTEAGAFPTVSKAKRALRIMALSAPLLVLGAGFVYAQSQNSPGTTASAASPISTATTAVSIPAIVATTAAASVTTQHTSLLSSTPVKASNISFNFPIKKPTGGSEDANGSGEGNGDDNSTLSLSPAPTLSPLSSGTPSIGGIKKPTGGSEDANGSDD